MKEINKEVIELLEDIIFKLYGLMDDEPELLISINKCEEMINRLADTPLEET